MTQAFNILSLPRPARLIETARARMRRPDIDVAAVQAILEQYGLALAAPPRNMSANRRNHNVTVETAAGKWLLKRYRPQWRKETVIYGHAILARLAELDFPVPRLATASDGRDFVAQGAHSYALLEFVDGFSYSSRFLLRADRRRLMAMIGAAMARIHRLLQGFLPPGSHHLGFIDYSGPRRRDIDWLIGKLIELGERSQRLDQHEERPHAEWLIRNAGTIAEQLAPLDALLCDAPLIRTVIHGDYGLHNVLFQQDGTVIVLDFEISRLEWRLSDLVSCLSRFRYSDGAYDFQSIQWFMQAYADEYPLSSDEWRLLPQVWRYYKLQSAVQYWVSYFETSGPVRKLISARDAVEQAAWAARYSDALRAQLQASHLR